MRKITLLIIMFFSSISYSEELKTQCQKATSEDQLNCLLDEYEQIDNALVHLINEIKTKRAEDILFINNFGKAQTDWEISFKSDCGSVYDLWRYGSVKNIKWFDCKIELTKKRIEFLNAFYGPSADGA